MTIQQAIKKAIEGGYSPKFLKEYVIGKPLLEKIAVDYPDKTLLDPLFWSSLGKSMGWAYEGHVGYGGGYYVGIPQWKYNWHRFIDHLAEGKSIASYFETL